MQGDLAGAGAAYEQVLQANPKCGEAYRDLGILLLDAGVLAKASEALAAAVRLAPNDPGAWYHQGLVSKLLGRDEAALEAYARAIEIKPDYAEAYANLAKMAIDRGEYEVGERFCRKAIKHRPKMAQAHVNLGLVLRERGDLPQALRSARQGVRLDPSSAPAQSNLGNIYLDLKRYDEALRCFRKAVEAQPDFATGYFNHANALRLLYRLGEAEEAYTLAIGLNPGCAEYRHNLGLTYQEMGRQGEALEAFRQAHELAPGNLGMRFSLARSLQRNNHLCESWQHFDAGFEAGLRKPNRAFAIPRWQGEEGKHLLVWREQGLGDEIAFARNYADLAGQVTIEADKRLLGLFKRSFPGIEFRAEDFANDGAGCDFHLPAGNLLQHFPKRERGAYLRPDPELVTALAKRLPEGFKLGICWRSQFTHRDRDFHYPPLLEWGPILTLPGIEFINLQYDNCEAELIEAEQAFGVKIHRWPDLDLRDDLETVFALTQHLDMVVSASTAPARIADALGKDVWIMAAGAEQPSQPPETEPLFGHCLQWQRHWTETWQDLIPRVSQALKGAIC